MMKYAWVSLSILAIWVSTVLLMLSGKIVNPESFFLFIVIVTVALSFIGFRSAQ